MTEYASSFEFSNGNISIYLYAAFKSCFNPNCQSWLMLTTTPWIKGRLACKSLPFPLSLPPSLIPFSLPPSLQQMNTYFGSEYLRYSNAQNWQLLLLYNLYSSGGRQTTSKYMSDSGKPYGDKRSRSKWIKNVRDGMLLIYKGQSREALLSRWQLSRETCVSHEEIRRKNIWGRGKTRYKGAVVGMCLACSQEAQSGVRLWWSKWEEE